MAVGREKTWGKTCQKNCVESREDQRERFSKRTKAENHCIPSNMYSYGRREVETMSASAWLSSISD